MFARAALISVVLLATASLAAAQVATSDLTAGTSRYIHPQGLGLNRATHTPDNPAALQWGGPSRAGVGVIDGEVKQPPDTYDISGRFAGLRAVGESWAAGAGYQTSEVSGTGASLDTTDLTAQLSFQFGETLAVGGELGSFETDDGSVSQTVNRQAGGISLRFGSLYLGALFGRDKMEFDPSPPGFPEPDRNIVGYGIALKTERSDWQWYLAYDLLDYDPFFTGGGLGLKLSTVTGQVLAGNLLLGASAGKLEPDDASPDQDIDTMTVDVGWVPSEGLSFSARRQELTESYLSGGVPVEDTVTTTALALNLMF